MKRTIKNQQKKTGKAKELRGAVRKLVPALEDSKDYALRRGPNAIEQLFQIGCDPSITPRLRVRALSIIFDVAFGKVRATPGEAKMKKNMTK